MEYTMVLAGFGGQGVLLAGQLIAEAGMLKDKNVSWMPSYGPEMRGGSANCAVIISDDSIGSPMVANPEILVAMNLPSLDLFEPNIKPGGYLIYNTSLIERKPTRDDITVIGIPFNDIANELGNPKTVNMPIIGAVMELVKFFGEEDIKKIMFEKFGEKKQAIIELNMKAITKGKDIVRDDLK